MASLMNELVDLDSTELDKLIHSFEYENQHCVKMIERKNQVINSLSNQIEHQVQERRRLEEEISKFDDDTRRLHRNYTNNRDNISCLKNTMSVMSDHMGALSKQLSALQIKTSEERKTYNEHLNNYSKTRDEYMAKYRAFPLALNLEKAQKAVETLQEKVKEFGKSKNSIAEQISEIEDELGTKVMSRIIVKMVRTKIITQGLESEIHECVTKKKILLEQLKELQKSKQDQQEAAIASQVDSLKAPEDAMNDTYFNETEEARMCSDETDHLSNLCIEETSYEHQDEITNAKKLTQKNSPLMKRNFENTDNLDMDGDVSMEEIDPSAQQCDQSTHHMIQEQPCLQPEISKPSAKRNLPTGEDQFGAAPNTMSSINLSKSQLLLPHQENPVLGRPRLSLPRVPSLSRMCPTLRLPSLNFPRGSRVQQPRLISGVQRKTLPIARTTNFPKMKQPSPPPLKAPTLPTSINLPFCKEQSSVPQFGSMKGNPPPLKAQVSISSSTNLHLRQQLTKPSYGMNAESQQKGKSQIIQSVQEMPLREPYFMPLNDVCNKPMSMDEDQEHKSATIRKREFDYSEKKKIECSEPMKKIPLVSSTSPAAKEGISDENEPVFKLVHTFGNQNSLESDDISSQQKSINDKDQHQDQFYNAAPGKDSVSQKSSLMSHLESLSMGDTCSPDTEVEQRGIFGFFDISQKTNTFNDIDEVEDGESFRSVFTFNNIGVNSGNNNDTAAPGGYFGTSDLLGMVTTGTNQCEEGGDSEAFHFEIGLSKETDEECGNQPSFFNFTSSNFNNFL